MKGFAKATVGSLAVVVVLSFAGCGGDSGPAEVKFPDVSKLPAPPAPTKTKLDTSLQGPTSQGDPTESSRKK
jgi:hypothetical protein